MIPTEVFKVIKVEDALRIVGAMAMGVKAGGSITGFASVIEEVIEEFSFEAIEVKNEQSRETKTE